MRFELGVSWKKILILLGIAWGGGLYAWWNFGRSIPFKMAKAFSINSPAIVSVLGSPIDVSRTFLAANRLYSQIPGPTRDEEDCATVILDLKGARRSGRFKAFLMDETNGWTFMDAKLEMPDGQKIDVTPKPVGPLAATWPKE